MSIYTKNGDNGTSYIIGRRDISKSQPIFDVLGTLDELNSILGIAISEVPFSNEAEDFLLSIQKNLFRVGSLVGNSNADLDQYSWLEGEILKLENAIDETEKQLPKLTRFILPGGSQGAAKLHLARAVCRRLERRVVEFYESSEKGVSKFVLMYINRLSDFLFVLARYINLKLNYEEKTWKL